MYGDTTYDLSLNRIQDESLLEAFGLERVLSSMALQRQEEVDVFFNDAVWPIILAIYYLFFFFFEKKKILIFFNFLIIYISQET